MAFLSVIVPIYGVEKYLRQCIDSIVAQTYQDLEIILVDDGSKDLCPAICDEYASKCSVIRVLHKPNGGLVSARKAGLEIATGKYIAFVDGDDYIDSNMYEKMCFIANNTEADIVVAGFCFQYFDKQENWNDKINEGLYDKKGLCDLIYPIMMCHEGKLDRGVAPAVWNKIFRKELLQKVLPYVPNTIKDGEDAAITYPTMLEARSIYFMSELYPYHYRILESSMSHHYDSRWYISASDYCDWIEECIGKIYSDLAESIELEKYRMYHRYIIREYLHYREKGIRHYTKRMRFIRKTKVGTNGRNMKVSCLQIPVCDKMICHILKCECYTLLYIAFTLINMISNRRR